MPQAVPALESEHLLTRLPLPLAQLFRRAQNARSPREIHDSAYYVAEAALKLAASVRIGLILDLGVEPNSPLARSLERLVLPSAGQWVSFLRETSNELRGRKDAQSIPLAGTHAELLKPQTIPSVVRFAERASLADGGSAPPLNPLQTKSASRQGVMGFFEMMVAYRNQVIGHGAQRRASYYEQMGPLLLNAVADIVSSDCILGGLTLAVPQVAHDQHGRAVAVHWKGLRGLMSVRLATDQVGNGGKEEQRVLEQAGRVFAIGPGARIPLHPLVVYEEDEHERERVGLLNRADSRRSGAANDDQLGAIEKCEYLDYATGDQFSCVDASHELANLQASLRGEQPADTTKSITPEADSTVTSPVGPAGAMRVAIPASPPVPGSRFGNYEILEEIASGGMGVIYKARQISLNRIVALKTILPGLNESPDSIERFRIEAESVAKLDHPGIVPVYDHGNQEGLRYLVMGWVDGQDLATRAARGSISPTEAARIVRDAALAIEHAHERGVLHRDLKPANIMIDQAGRVRVTDFGLARSVDEADQLTMPGQVLGTPAYMPPEQATGGANQAGRTSDVYSLGAVLYFLLTGRAPFEGATRLEIMRRVCDQPPQPPRELRPDLSPQLETICLRCLAKSPPNRYASGSELASDLDRAIATLDSPGPAKPSNGHKPGELKFKLLNRWGIAAAALLILIGAAVFVIGHIGGSRPPDPNVEVVKSTSTDTPPVNVPPQTHPARIERPPSEPLHGSLTLRIWDPKDTNRTGLALMDSGVLPLRAGDLFRVEASATRPIYLYVVWVDPEGIAKPVYPWPAGDWSKPLQTERPVTEIKLPAGNDKWEMPDEQGMETLVLLGREQPLPPGIVLKDMFTGLFPPLVKSPDSIVWLKPPEDQRSPDFSAFKKAGDPVRDAQRRLADRFNRHFPLLQVVSFANRGNSKVVPGQQK